MKILVDIDNILWNFADVFWEKLKTVNPAMPPPAAWAEWRFWEPYMGSDSFYHAIKEVHLTQAGYSPYPEAAWFLQKLKEDHLTIVIASHRDRETLSATEKWLTEHGLVFDELHVSHDKSVLFGECCALVDDSPLTLKKAEEAGIVRAGLLYPWNASSGQPLFSSLQDILDYLESECRNLRR